MLKIKNTLSKQLEEFKPIEGSEVTMYTCGPTVYDYASIGNFSAYIMADLVKRYLRHLGYKVKHITNITDVGHLTADADVSGEDKLEVAAKKEGIDPLKIAEKYTTQFMNDCEALGVTADMWPRASDHIPEMLAIIEKLIEKGYAYVKESGVYFDVEKDPDYGKLSGNTLEQLKSGARVEVHPDKKHPADFALWKLNQPNHLLQWDSPWGIGYPGWHIECSAMSTKYLGDQIDIHTGGEDNIFPHHECEIAQTECATSKKPFVKYWLHRHFLTVDGKKMSKSLGNTYRLQDLIDKGFEPEDFRMLILAAHYRSGVNFTFDALAAAKERRQRWQAAYLLAKPEGSLDNLVKVELALDNDLNTSEAFAVVDEVVKNANSGVSIGLGFWQSIDKLFGLRLAKVSEVDSSALDMADCLDIARKEKDYVLADKLRGEIIAKGYEVITTDGGTKIRKK